MVALAHDLLPEELDVLARVAERDLDVASMLVVQNTHRAAQALRARLEQQALASEELSWSSFTLLFCLWVWGPTEVRELARRMGVTRPTVSGVADTLQARGLVERRPSGDDRRLVAIALTSDGERAFAELFPRFNGHESACCAGLDAAESAELARLLRKLIQSVGKDAAHGG